MPRLHSPNISQITAEMITNARIDRPIGFPERAAAPLGVVLAEEEAGGATLLLAAEDDPGPKLWLGMETL